MSGVRSKIWFLSILVTGSLVALGRTATVGVGDWVAYEKARDCSVFRSVASDAERVVSEKRMAVDESERDAGDLRGAFENCALNNGVGELRTGEDEVVGAQTCPIEFELWLRQGNSAVIARQDLKSATEGLDFILRQISYYCGKLPRKTAPAGPPVQF